MRKLSLIVLLALGVFVLVQPLSLGQNASVTVKTSFDNQAVFISKVSDFTANSDISITDIEAGCKSLGNASVNVDATSGYSVTAQVTAIVVPAGATSSAANEDPFHLDNATLCPAAGNDGTATAAIGNGTSTAGTSGTDFNIFGAVFFKNDGAYFTDAPNGNYEATVTITVTD